MDNGSISVFHDLMETKYCTLPKSIPDNKDFKGFLFELLDGYIDRIRSSEEAFSKLRTALKGDDDTVALSSNYARNRFAMHLRSIQFLTMGIKDAIEHYYNGRPSSAYTALSEGIKNGGINNYLDKNQRLNPESNFYRLRTSNGNYPFQRCEMFHIPFDQRGKVKTQRFSIPGYPSLYLSNSIYTAWEELGRPKESEVQAVRIVNIRDVRYLDLTTDFYVDDYMNYDKEDIIFLYKVVTWPLVAACSIKVKNKQDTFKPEYIIPQLLLQWINYNVLDGILYSSTHIDKNNTGAKGKFWNMVMPVKTNNPNGYCTELSQKLMMTDVVTFAINNMARGAGAQHYNPERHVNNDVDLIEILQGHPYRYGYSPLSLLESAVNDFDAKPINFTR